MKTLEELQAIRDRMKAEITQRETPGGSDTKVVVGMATCGIAAGAREVMMALTQEVSERGLTNVKVGQTGCIGICKYEPIMEVTIPGKEKVTYVYMTGEKVKNVIRSHVINGQPVTEYTYGYALEHNI